MPSLRVLSYSLFALTATARCIPSSPSSSIQIFVDFDGTIVTSDAYTALATAAYASLPSSKNTSSSILPWDEIEEIYGQRYDEAAAQLPQPSSLASAIAYSNAPSLRAVEEWSFNWVKGMGLFLTAKESELVKLAQKQTLRKGWCAFALTAQKHDMEIHVVSLNWSPSWIRLVLEQASTCPELVSRISTYSPQILPLGALPSSPLNHGVPLFSGGDKTALIKRLLSSIPAVRKKKVVFVSDGDADLQPLWQSPTNVGVVAGYDGSAAEAFALYGVDVRDAGQQGWRGFTGEKTNAVYGFEDWGDVASLLWP
jgi:2-hydroxy-3-keto-5-methylthiopentenyl-1-phosphate phosphatase